MAIKPKLATSKLAIRVRIESTNRQHEPDKRGAILKNAPPILDRLNRVAISVFRCRRSAFVCATRRVFRKAQQFAGLFIRQYQINHVSAGVMERRGDDLTSVEMINGRLNGRGRPEEGCLLSRKKREQKKRAGTSNVVLLISSVSFG